MSIMDQIPRYQKWIEIVDYSSVCIRQQLKKFPATRGQCPLMLSPNCGCATQSGPLALNRPFWNPRSATVLIQKQRGTDANTHCLSFSRNQQAPQNVTVMTFVVWQAYNSRMIHALGVPDVRVLENADARLCTRVRWSKAATHTKHRTVHTQINWTQQQESRPTKKSTLQ